ncbi:glycosyltransferase [Fischerella thermalis]|uniref:glycosyltransferase n=1 Tax=Fischerella thermalis TaxID=372787 RepID=UPI001A0338D2|nr:glycosyltransferase [Fischerella thermalis]MBF1991280.1 glycosyltransferase [Fischerella thermalis M58_A2018_009]MBF2061516.1 glycosyltransferase [Fischerella thermalis M66_A2018_004]MBF2071085.1 glycosyltransferase [Fischerella thermalis M48_A2018_028]
MDLKPEISNNTFSNNFGVNISGYVNSEFGLGEGVRGTIRAVEAAGIPFVINNCTFNTMHRKMDSSYTDFSDENPYRINIIQVNVDMINTFISSTSPEYFKDKYNIGFWAWELPEFPKEWLSAFNLFHEIWTPSAYCVDAIAPVSPIPVLKVMHSISLARPSISKQSLGLPNNKFIFLFTFDFCSVFERKNPAAVIEAFKQAFGKDNEYVLLVIKFSNANYFPVELQKLLDLIEGFTNIKLIDNYLLKDELNALIYHCDCYISLHRAEGFGLTMAEAMFYGKPVIATAYSGNTEYMNINNSFLVKYSLVKLTEDHGPYKKGNVWAEPDIDHAAYLMQYVFNNYEEAKQLGIKGAKSINAMLNPKVIGEKIKSRLEYNVQPMQSTLSPIYAELYQKNLEINRLKILVDAMESSKFWQMRKQWFKFKRMLKIKVIE